MNKARITYRLDPNRTREEEPHVRGREDGGRVIPLYQEEYRVVEEREAEYREPVQEAGSDPGREEAYQEAGTDSRRSSWGGSREEDRQGMRPEARQEARNEARQETWSEARQSAYDSRRGPGRGSNTVRDYQPLNQYTTDYGAWNSPFDAETREIEEMIRTSNERAGRRPMGDDPVPYDRPGRYVSDYAEREADRRQEARYSGEAGYYQPPAGGSRDVQGLGYEGPEVIGPHYVRHNRPPWLKISAAVTGAAVTGVLLGFFALSLFNGQGHGTKTADSAQTADQQAQPVSAAVQETDVKNTGGTSAATGKEIPMSYAGKTYSILQNGIFANQQGADQVKNDLIKKGLAAATEQTDKYYVYAGIAMDKDSAAGLGKQLKENSKVDIYVKPYAVPAVTKVVWNGSADKLKAYLEQSDKLLQTIDLLTVLNLDGSKPGDLDAATVQSIAASHAAWSQLASAVSQDAGETNKALVQRMNNAMNSAKTSLDEYKKNPSASMLWQAQTYVLQFIIAEKDLLTRIQ